MTKKVFVPGVRVLASVNNEEYGDGEIISYQISEYSDNTLTGTVMDKPAETGFVFVKFDENDWEHDEEEVEENILVLESDLPQLEKEFEKVSKEITKKMKKAADLINEAGQLAESAHGTTLQSMWEASRPLVQAMDANGWNSSSWGC